MRLAKEGFPTIVTVLTVALIAGWGATRLPEPWTLAVWILLALPAVLVIYFFRDPERKVPDDTSLVISPADGRVVLVKETEESEYLDGPATQVSIFLSPLDVHVNRIPVEGTLEYLSYFPGKYLMAWDEHASEMNERAHFGVLHPGGRRVLFKQITGFLARRIVYHINEGDRLRLGDRFGIMKFGSRMDLLLPPDIKIEVSEGDRTVAGESIIARIPE